MYPRTRREAPRPRVSRRARDAAVLEAFLKKAEVFLESRVRLISTPTRTTRLRGRREPRPRVVKARHEKFYPRR